MRCADAMAALIPDGPGLNLGIGFGAVVVQNTVPLELISSNLLYCRCTSHVLAPTVMLSASPLHMSPFSSLVGPHHPFWNFGSVHISMNSWLVTWVRRCSCVWARCSEQDASFAQEFFRHRSFRPGMTA